MHCLAAVIGIFLATMTAAGFPVPAVADEARGLLAPLGKLRVGVYPGSPLSLMVDRSTGQSHGLSHDLGAEFARRLGVAVEYTTYQRIADVLDAMKAGQLDFTVSNATPARAADVNFSQPVLALELGYLVPSNSPLTTPEEVDRPGMRIGVTKGSTSERTLPARFQHATIVPAQNLREAIDMLNNGQLDVYMTNKPILYEMSDAMSGARILAGNWGVEHVAVAIPKGREAAMDVVRNFVNDVQSSGLLAQFQTLAGLRGAVAAVSK
jgi:polar amino acid transport system substrate-binding protein